MFPYFTQKTLCKSAATDLPKWSGGERSQTLLGKLFHCLGAITIKKQAVIVASWTHWLDGTTRRVGSADVSWQVGTHSERQESGSQAKKCIKGKNQQVGASRSSPLSPPCRSPFWDKQPCWLGGYSEEEEAGNITLPASRALPMAKEEGIGFAPFFSAVYQPMWLLLHMGPTGPGVNLPILEMGAGRERRARNIYSQLLSGDPGKHCALHLELETNRQLRKVF